MEWCPSCGEEVDELEDFTGWCSECSGVSKTKCIGCGRKFKKDLPHRKLCKTCRHERWLERNAERLDKYLFQGFTIREAQQAVYEANRPTCMSCTEPIPLARRNAHFCNRTSECRSWKRRYRTLYERFQRKGIIESKKKALAQVAAEIYIMRPKVKR